MKQLILLLFFILTSCSSLSSSEEIKLALDWTYNTNHIGILVAQEKGFYIQENIQLKILEFGKTGAGLLIGSQQVDLALSSQGELTFLKEAKIPVKSIATLLDHNPTGFYSLKNKNIQTPKDLQNKVYGGWGSIMEEAIIKAMIQLGRISQPKFENKLIGSINIQSALQNVDFIWGYEGWQGAQLQTQNLEYNFLPAGKYEKALDNYSPIILVNTASDFYKQKSEQIKKFLKATAKGYQWAILHPQDASNILLKYDPTLNINMIERSIEILKPYYLNRKGEWGYQEKRRYQEYLDFVKAQKVLKGDLEVSDLMTNEFLG